MSTKVTVAIVLQSLSLFVDFFKGSKRTSLSMVTVTCVTDSHPFLQLTKINLESQRVERELREELTSKYFISQYFVLK